MELQQQNRRTKTDKEQHYKIITNLLYDFVNSESTKGSILVVILNLYIDHVTHFSCPASSFTQICRLEFWLTLNKYYLDKFVFISMKIHFYLVVGMAQLVKNRTANRDIAGSKPV